MKRDDLILAIQIAQEMKNRKKYNKIDSYFKEEGPLRRELYTRHLEFFRAGLKYDERLFMAGNRVGKTEGGAYELICHLTGEYPSWWEGRRFDRAIDAWACGKTGQTVRDIVQFKIVGDFKDFGTGLLRKKLIEDATPKRGIPEAIDTLYIKHKTGEISRLGFKSYDQGRQSFEGTKKDVIWLDEEPELDIYTECLLRTTATEAKSKRNSLIYLTFTPLKGMSEVVLTFLEDGDIEKPVKSGNKHVTIATWDDVPHLTDEVKEKLLSSIPPFQRDARSKGVPQLGSGAIYPVPESDVFIDDFKIPDHYPRAFGFDVGWNSTAAIWGAWDNESDILYIYSEHKRGEAEPSIHAQAIRARGDFITGVIDPASRGRSQVDGRKLFQMYVDLGVSLEFASNAVETGIYEVWQRLSTGRLKIFNSLSETKKEYRLYRRNEKGQIVKKNDHLMDALRYLVISGREYAKPKQEKEEKPTQFNVNRGFGGGWYG